jgi:hypothetical protein
MQKRLGISSPRPTRCNLNGKFNFVIDVKGRIESQAIGNRRIDPVYGLTADSVVNPSNGVPMTSPPRPPHFA